MKVLFSIVFFWIVSLQVTLAQDTWKEILNNKSGTVEILYYDSENYIYEKNGKLTGIEYDLIQELFGYLEKQHGVKINLRFKHAPSFGGLYETIRFGKPGQFGACSFSMTPQRTEEVLFSPKYMPDIEVLVSNADLPLADDTSAFLKKFATSTAFVVRNTTFEQDILTLKQWLPNIRMAYVNTGVEALEKIAETPNSFGYSELPNYIAAIEKGLKLRRQSLFKVERMGHGLILPKRNDWAEAIRPFFDSPGFQGIMSKILKKNLGNDVRDLLLEIGGNKSPNSEINLLNKEVEIQQMELEKQELESERQLLIRNVSIVSVIVAVFIAGLLFYYNRQKQASNRLLQAQKDEILQQKLIIETSNKNILDSIHYARLIQQSILPDDQQMKNMLGDSFVLYLPKDIISGDFYFVGKPASANADDITVFGVGDCTGHGVPGALLSIIGKTFLQLGLADPSVQSCADSLNYLNRGLVNILQSGQTTIRDGMDIALCSINHRTLELEFAGGNNPAYVVRGEQLFLLKPDKFGIGENDGEMASFSNTRFQLEKGDCIYLFSDGYGDQFGGPKGKKFRAAQMRELFLAYHTLPMAEQGSLMHQQFLDWKQDLEQVDDVCLLGVRV